MCQIQGGLSKIYLPVVSKEKAYGCEVSCKNTNSLLKVFTTRDEINWRHYVNLHCLDLRIVNIHPKLIETQSQVPNRIAINFSSQIELSSEFYTGINLNCELDGQITQANFVKPYEIECLFQITENITSQQTLNIQLVNRNGMTSTVAGPKVIIKPKPNVLRIEPKAVAINIPGQHIHVYGLNFGHIQDQSFQLRATDNQIKSQILSDTSLYLVLQPIQVQENLMNIAFEYLLKDGTTTPSNLKVQIPVLVKPQVTTHSLTTYLNSESITLEGFNFDQRHEYECHFNLREIVSSTKIGKTNSEIICELAPELTSSTLKTHTLRLFSAALHQYISREIPLHILAPPYITSVAPLYILTNLENQKITLQMSSNPNLYLVHHNIVQLSLNLIPQIQHGQNATDHLDLFINGSCIQPVKEDNSLECTLQSELLTSTSHLSPFKEASSPIVYSLRLSGSNNSSATSTPQTKNQLIGYSQNAQSPIEDYLEQPMPIIITLLSPPQITSVQPTHLLVPNLAAAQSQTIRLHITSTHQLVDYAVYVGYQSHNNGAVVYQQVLGLGTSIMEIEDSYCAGGGEQDDGKCKVVEFFMPALKYFDGKFSLSEEEEEKHSVWIELRYSDRIIAQIRALDWHIEQQKLPYWSKTQIRLISMFEVYDVVKTDKVITVVDEGSEIYESVIQILGKGFEDDAEYECTLSRQYEQEIDQRQSIIMIGRARGKEKVFCTLIHEEIEEYGRYGLWIGVKDNLIKFQVADDILIVNKPTVTRIEQQVVHQSAESMLLSIYGKWMNTSMHFEPIVKLNQKRFRAELDFYSPLSLLHVKIDNLQTDLYTVQVSIDGGKTFSDLQIQDTIEILTRRSVIVLEPIILNQVKPEIIDKLTSPESIQFEIRGEGLSQSRSLDDVWCKIIGLKEDSLTDLYAYSEDIVKGNSLDDNTLQCAPAMIKQDVYNDVEQFQIAITLNNQYSWEIYKDTILVFDYPRFTNPISKTLTFLQPANLPSSFTAELAYGTTHKVQFEKITFFLENEILDSHFQIEVSSKSSSKVQFTVKPKTDIALVIDQATRGIKSKLMVVSKIDNLSIFTNIYVQFADVFQVRSDLLYIFQHDSDILIQGNGFEKLGLEGRLICQPSGIQAKIMSNEFVKCPSNTQLLVVPDFQNLTSAIESYQVENFQLQLDKDQILQPDNNLLVDVDFSLQNRQEFQNLEMVNITCHLEYTSDLNIIKRLTTSAFFINNHTQVVCLTHQLIEETLLQPPCTTTYKLWISFNFLTVVSNGVQTTLFDCTLEDNQQERIEISLASDKVAPVTIRRSHISNEIINFDLAFFKGHQQVKDGFSSLSDKPLLCYFTPNEIQTLGYWNDFNIGCELPKGIPDGTYSVQISIGQLLSNKLKDILLFDRSIQIVQILPEKLQAFQQTELIIKLNTKRVDLDLKCKLTKDDDQTALVLYASLSDTIGNYKCSFIPQAKEKVSVQVLLGEATLSFLNDGPTMQVIQVFHASLPSDTTISLSPNHIIRPQTVSIVISYPSSSSQAIQQEQEQLYQLLEQFDRCLFSVHGQPNKKSSSEVASLTREYHDSEDGWRNSILITCSSPDEVSGSTSMRIIDVELGSSSDEQTAKWQQTIPVGQIRVYQDVGLSHYEVNMGYVLLWLTKDGYPVSMIQTISCVFISQNRREMKLIPIGVEDGRVKCNLAVEQFEEKAKDVLIEYRIEGSNIEYRTETVSLNDLEIDEFIFIQRLLNSDILFKRIQRTNSSVIKNTLCVFDSGEASSLIKIDIDFLIQLEDQEQLEMLYTCKTPSSISQNITLIDMQTGLTLGSFFVSESPSLTLDNNTSLSNNTDFTYSIPLPPSIPNMISCSTRSLLLDAPPSYGSVTYSANPPAASCTLQSIFTKSSSSPLNPSNIEKQQLIYIHQAISNSTPNPSSIFLFQPLPGFFYSSQQQDHDAGADLPENNGELVGRLNEYDNLRMFRISTVGTDMRSIVDDDDGQQEQLVVYSGGRRDRGEVEVAQVVFQTVDGREVGGWEKGLWCDFSLDSGQVIASVRGKAEESRVVCFFGLFDHFEKLKVKMRGWNGVILSSDDRYINFVRLDQIDFTISPSVIVCEDQLSAQVSIHFDTHSELLPSFVLIKDQNRKRQWIQEISQSSFQLPCSKMHSYQNLTTFDIHLSNRQIYSRQFQRVIQLKKPFSLVQVSSNTFMPNEPLLFDAFYRTIQTVQSIHCQTHDPSTNITLIQNTTLTNLYSCQDVSPQPMIAKSQLTVTSFTIQHSQHLQTIAIPHVSQSSGHNLPNLKGVPIITNAFIQKPADGVLVYLPTRDTAIMSQATIESELDSVKNPQQMLVSSSEQLSFYSQTSDGGSSPSVSQTSIEIHIDIMSSDGGRDDSITSQLRDYSTNYLGSHALICVIRPKSLSSTNYGRVYLQGKWKYEHVCSCDLSGMPSDQVLKDEEGEESVMYAVALEVRGVFGEILFQTDVRGFVEIVPAVQIQPNQILTIHRRFDSKFQISLLTGHPLLQRLSEGKHEMKFYCLISSFNVQSNKLGTHRAQISEYNKENLSLTCDMSHFSKPLDLGFYKIQIAYLDQTNGKNQIKVISVVQAKLKNKEAIQFAHNSVVPSKLFLTRSDLNFYTNSTQLGVTIQGNFRTLIDARALVDHSSAADSAQYELSKYKLTFVSQKSESMGRRSVEFPLDQVEIKAWNEIRVVFANVYVDLIIGNVYDIVLSYNERIIDKIEAGFSVEEALQTNAYSPKVLYALAADIRIQIDSMETGLDLCIISDIEGGLFYHSELHLDYDGSIVCRVEYPYNVIRLAFIQGTQIIPATEPIKIEYKPNITITNLVPSSAPVIHQQAIELKFMGENLMELLEYQLACVFSKSGKQFFATVQNSTLITCQVNASTPWYQEQLTSVSLKIEDGKNKEVLLPQVWFDFEFVPPVVIVDQEPLRIVTLENQVIRLIFKEPVTSNIIDWRCVLKQIEGSQEINLEVQSIPPYRYVECILPQDRLKNQVYTNNNEFSIYFSQNSGQNFQVAPNSLIFTDSLLHIIQVVETELMNEYSTVSVLLEKREDLQFYDFYCDAITQDNRIQTSFIAYPREQLENQLTCVFIPAIKFQTFSLKVHQPDLNLKSNQVVVQLEEAQTLQELHLSEITVDSTLRTINKPGDSITVTFTINSIKDFTHTSFSSFNSAKNSSFISTEPELPFTCNPLTYDRTTTQLICKFMLPKLATSESFPLPFRFTVLFFANELTSETSLQIPITVEETPQLHSIFPLQTLLQQYKSSINSANTIHLLLIGSGFKPYTTAFFDYTGEKEDSSIDRQVMTEEQSDSVLNHQKAFDSCLFMNSTHLECLVSYDDDDDDDDIGEVMMNVFVSNNDGLDRSVVQRVVWNDGLDVWEVVDVWPRGVPVGASGPSLVNIQEVLIQIRRVNQPSYRDDGEEELEIWCDFSTLMMNMTKVEVLNSTHLKCPIPYTLFQQGPTLLQLHSTNPRRIAFIYPSSSSSSRGNKDQQGLEFWLLPPIADGLTLEQTFDFGTQSELMTTTMSDYGGIVFVRSQMPIFLNEFRYDVCLDFTQSINTVAKDRNHLCMQTTKVNETTLMVEMIENGKKSSYITIDSFIFKISTLTDNDVTPLVDLKIMTQQTTVFFIDDIPSIFKLNIVSVRKQLETADVVGELFEMAFTLLPQMSNDSVYENFLRQHVKSVQCLITVENAVWERKEALRQKHNQGFSFEQFVCQGVKERGIVQIETTKQNSQLRFDFNLADFIENQENLGSRGARVRKVWPDQMSMGEEGEVWLSVEGDYLNRGKLACVYQYEGIETHDQVLVTKMIQTDATRGSCRLLYPVGFDSYIASQPDINPLTVYFGVRDESRLVDIEIDEDSSVLQIYRPIKLLNSDQKYFYLQQNNENQSIIVTIQGENFPLSSSCILLNDLWKVFSVETKYESSQKITCILTRTKNKKYLNQKQETVMEISLEWSTLKGYIWKARDSIGITIRPIFNITDETLVVIEDHQIGSNQALIHVQGNHFTSSLICVLILGENDLVSEVLEEPAYLLETPFALDCLFTSENLFKDGHLIGTLMLKDRNSVDNSYLTFSNQVPVKFVKRVQIWYDQSSLIDGYFLNQNDGQQVKFGVNKALDDIQQMFENVKVLCRVKMIEKVEVKTAIQDSQNGYLSCILPVITSQRAENVIQISIQINFTSKEDLTRYSTESNQFEITLKQMPQINSINPPYTPLNFDDNLINIYGVNFEQGFTSVLFDGRQIIDTQVLSSTHATFIAPTINSQTEHLAKIQMITLNYNETTTSKVSLEYLLLPEISRLLPSMIPQLVDKDNQGEPILRTITVIGTNFTVFTECLVNGVPQLTKFITDQLLQCQFNPQDFAPFAYSDNFLQIRLWERSLYLSPKDNHFLYLSNLPYVYKVEPAYLFTEISTFPMAKQSTNGFLKVYVSNDVVRHSVNRQEGTSLNFCKITDDLIVKVAKVEYNHLQECDDIESDPFLYATGYQNHQLKIPDICRTNYTVYHCKLPYIKKELGGSAYQVEILDQSGEAFSKSEFGAAGSTIQILFMPEILKVIPYVLPYNNDLERDQDIVEIIGNNLAISVDIGQLKCQFKGEKFMTQTIVSIVDSKKVQCSMPRTPEINCLQRPCYVSITLILELTTGEIVQTRGQGKIKLYDAPYITNLFPSNGKVTGGLKVLVKGVNLSSGLDSLHCMFGESVVSALFIQTQKVLTCNTPPMSSPGLYQFSISIDGGRHFFGLKENIKATFIYLPEVLVLNVLQPTQWDLWGGDLSIQIQDGQLDKLFAHEQDSNQSENIPVLCKVHYGGGSINISEELGQLVSSSEIRCPIEKHLVQSAMLNVQVSFNGVELYEIAEGLVMIDDNQIYPQIYGDTIVIEQSPEDLYQDILGLQSFPDQCPLSTRAGSQVKEFHLDAPILWNSDFIMHVNITQNLSNLPDDLSITDFLNTTLTYWTPQLSNRGLYEQQFDIDGAIQIKLRYEIAMLPHFEIGMQVYYFYQWLVHNRDVVLTCKSDPIEIFVTVRVYKDQTLDQNVLSQQMTCYMGAQQLQNYVKSADMLTVDCVMPFYSISDPVVFDDFGDINLISIFPEVAMLNQINLMVLAKIEPIFNTTSLACRAHDVILPGELYIGPDETWYIKCILPSIQYLESESVLGIPPDFTFVIEASLDGVIFTDEGIKFKYLLNDQDIYNNFSVGPDTGGTVISQDVIDFPLVNNKELSAQCLFPGHPLNGGLVDATFLEINKIQCISPPLYINQTSIELGFMFDTLTYTTVLVKVNMLNFPQQTYFRFTYMKDTRVDSFEPPNMFFDQGVTQRTLLINGNNFLPITGEMRCKISYTDDHFVEVNALYVNNHTLACDIPAALSNYTLPLAVPIEVSFNEGHQYTVSNSIFYYTPQDEIIGIWPERAYTWGNKPVFIKTGYFFNKASPVASCKFTFDNNHFYKVQVIWHNATHIVCNHPPAYLISDVLNLNGGFTQITISSNGVDFSSNSPWTFEYMLPVVITEMKPRFVLLGQETVVTLAGFGFDKQEPYNLRIRLTRESTNHEVEPTMVELHETVSHDLGTSVWFPFPLAIYGDKDWVKVEVSFDGVQYFMADVDTHINRLAVIKQMRLTRVWPSYVYLGVEGTEIHVQNGELKRSGQGGDIWNQEIYNMIKCKFISEYQSESMSVARFFNETHVGCLLPPYSIEELVKVDLTFDDGESLSEAPTYINLIPAPEIVSINNTAYYYTFNEQVYIKLTGRNLAKSGYLYVRTGEGQVQRIFDIQSNIEDPTLEEIVFKMPIQLRLGTYDIRISTDGINFKPDIEDTNRFTISVEKCPDGYICEQETLKVCPDAHFCTWGELQVFEPRECPLGTYMTDEGANECKVCDAGRYCPDTRLFVSQQCPHGLLCQEEGQYSVVQLKECPAGYICPTQVTNELDPLKLHKTGNMQKCPDGHYCLKGMQQGKHIYGNSTTPQICKDGHICAQDQEFQDLPDKSGSTDRYGNHFCKTGTYCQKGLAIECEKGQYCPKQNTMKPIDCFPGFYNDAQNQTQCDVCPFGTFCFFSGMEVPIKCKPGWVCQHQGAQTPAQICPAGSFCGISITTNSTNSTIEELYKPNYCYESTYCLGGVYTPIVNPYDKQAAQACIAGTFCGEGSDSPDGKGKCKEGYYCPEGSNQMIPSPPGSSALGTGNTIATMCSPGSFQDLYAQASCKPCPTGYQCPFQNMTSPILCGYGKYTKTLSSTQCQNCPLGTYSDALGVVSDELCKPCDQRFRCTVTGLSFMREADPCQEGFTCGFGTTTSLMLNSRVPTGFFGDYNATNFVDFFICLPGRYCPEATAASKVKQLECLRGYFCPQGTAASLDIRGNFAEGLHMVNKWDLIREIREGLTVIQTIVDEFEKEFFGLSVQDLIDDMKSKGDLPGWTDLQWRKERYEYNITVLQNRTKYIEEVLLPNVICPEDLVLPDELIIDFMKNGTNLKCPRGTTSDRAADCIGKCQINIANREQVSILNPVRDVLSITSLFEPELSMKKEELGSLVERLNQENDLSAREFGRRLSLNDGFRNYSIVGDGVYDELHRQRIRPLESAKIFIDLRELPEKMIYNDHFQILIFDEDGKEQRMPGYFSTTNNKITKKNELLEIRVFNWLDVDQYFTVGLFLYHGLYVPYLEQLSDKIWIELYQAERQTRSSNYTHAAIISEVILEGITLPYNSPDYGNDPKIWLDFTSAGENINPTTKYLDKDAFDSTYWQSKQISTVVMPWIPYFSNCDNFDSHMVFFEVFENAKLCEMKKYDEISIVNPIPFSGFSPVSDNCDFQIRCRYDEDLTYKRSQTTRWYQLLEPTRMFYVTREPVPIENFHKLEDSEVIQTFYNALIEDGSDDIVPVNFHPGQLTGIPRTVTLEFLYFQVNKDQKVVQSMNVYMSNYTEDEFYEDGVTVNVEYELKVNYHKLMQLFIIQL